MFVCILNTSMTCTKTRWLFKEPLVKIAEHLSSQSLPDCENSFEKQKKEQTLIYIYQFWKTRSDGSFIYDTLFPCETCCNETNCDNIIHMYIQAKTAKAVK